MEDTAKKLDEELRIEDLNRQIIERKRANKTLELEISRIDKELARKTFRDWVRHSAIATVVAIGGFLTVGITALTYAKSVSDTANDRFYALLEQLSKYREVSAENAPTIAVLVSRLDSELFSAKHDFLINTENRGFEIAYVVMPFAKAFGNDVDTAGVLAATVLAKAISRVNNPVHRDRLVADWGNHINLIQGKDTSVDYLEALMDVTCELDLLSERVDASTSDRLEECRKRMTGKF